MKNSEIQIRLVEEADRDEIFNLMRFRNPRALHVVRDMGFANVENQESPILQMCDFRRIATEFSGA